MEASGGLLDRPITTEARKALVALERCVQASGSRSRLAEAQLARFNLWATNIGVFANSKASVDFRLRDSPDVQRIIINLLDVVGIYAGLALRAELDLLSPNEGGEPDSGLLAGSEPAASRAQPGDLVSCLNDCQVRPPSKLSMGPAYQSVEDTITRLHRLSTAIRNAGVRNPYSRISRLAIVDEDGDDINDLFESYVSRVLRVRYSRLPAVLERRITNAICFRRRRFLYNRLSGQKDDGQDAPQATPNEPDPVPAPAPLQAYSRSHPAMSGAPQRLSVPALTSRTASTFYPHRFQAPRPSQPSVASTASPRTYAPRMHETIPKPPSIPPGQKEAQCPFCPFVIDAKYLTGTRWIKHFLDDLEPYVCLFQGCTSPHGLFASVEQWLSHMKAHPRPATEWVCSMRHAAPTQTVMQSAEEFATHLRDAHPGRFTNMQIERLQTRAARPGSIFSTCLFCDWSMPSASAHERLPGGFNPIDEHIADHLFDLALMSLPQMRNIKGVCEDQRESLAIVSLDSADQNSHSALSQCLSGFDDESCRSPSFSPSADGGITHALMQEAMTAAPSLNVLLPGQQMSAQVPQAASEPPVAVPPTAPQVKAESHVSQPVAQQGQMNTAANAQDAASGKGNKAPSTDQAPRETLLNDAAADAQLPPMQKATRPTASQEGPALVQPKPNMRFTREQLAAMTPEQCAQSGGSISRASAEEAWNNLPARIRTLYDMLANAIPPNDAVTLTVEESAGMSQRLRELTPYLGRLDAPVAFLGTGPFEERDLRMLLVTRLKLMRQFKSGSDWILTDQYSITPEYLASSTDYIERLFQHMSVRVSQSKESDQGTGTGHDDSNPPLPRARKTPSNDASPLSATNENPPNPHSPFDCQWADCFPPLHCVSWDSLALHLDVFHISTGENLYMCPVEECPSNSRRKTELMAHLQQEHQSHPQALKEYRNLRGNATQFPRVLRCKWNHCASADLYSSNELLQHIYHAHIESPHRAGPGHNSNPMSEQASRYNARLHGVMQAEGDLIPGLEPPEGTAEEESDLIKCICELSHDDGNTICCDTCNKWQHIICYYDDYLESPETHLCRECQPRPLDVPRAKGIQKEQLEQAARARIADDVSKTRKRRKKEKGEIGGRSRKKWAVSSPLPRRVEPESASDLFPNETEPLRKRKLHTTSAPLPRSTTSPQGDLRREMISLPESRERGIKEQGAPSGTATQTDTRPTGETPAGTDASEGSTG